MTTLPAENGRVGIALLGSTGSVGRQTLAVVDAHPERFRIVSIAARTISDRFLGQIARYRPHLAATLEPGAPPDAVESRYATGAAGLIEVATHPAVDIVVVATAGHSAIVPTIRAIEHDKTIALANKETLVCAGAIIMPLARARGVEIRPVDSEHSAVWQALRHETADRVQRVILTASGGPFRTSPLEQMASVTVQDALAHPTWSMGGKISIDSATMMNKGLEIIEAHWLFDIAYDRIEVLVHPESIVHSLVEFRDGSQIAQLGLPDMRLPIQYALAHPERLPSGAPPLRLADIASLHFAAPDEERFPALRIAREAGIAGGTYPTVLSAADDVAVASFLDGSVRFVDIAAIVDRVLARHDPSPQVTVESIAAADAWARAAARDAIIARR